jgi:hypothetical protein
LVSAETWHYPRLLDAVKPADIEWLLDEVSEGDYRLNTQAKDWVGHLLIHRLKLDPNDDGAIKRVAAVIKVHAASGLGGACIRRSMKAPA